MKKIKGNVEFVGMTVHFWGEGRVKEEILAVLFLKKNCV